MLQCLLIIAGLAGYFELSFFETVAIGVVVVCILSNYDDPGVYPEKVLQDMRNRQANDDRCKISLLKEVIDLIWYDLMLFIRNESKFGSEFDGSVRQVKLKIKEVDLGYERLQFENLSITRLKESKRGVIEEVVMDLQLNYPGDNRLEFYLDLPCLRKFSVGVKNFKIATNLQIKIKRSNPNDLSDVRIVLGYHNTPCIQFNLIFHHDDQGDWGVCVERIEKRLQEFIETMLHRQYELRLRTNRSSGISWAIDNNGVPISMLLLLSIGQCIEILLLALASAFSMLVTLFVDTVAELAKQVARAFLSPVRSFTQMGSNAADWFTKFLSDNNLFGPDGEGDFFPGASQCYYVLTTDGEMMKFPENERNLVVKMGRAVLDGYVGVNEILLQAIHDEVRRFWKLLRQRENRRRELLRMHTSELNEHRWEATNHNNIDVLDAIAVPFRFVGNVVENSLDVAASPFRFVASLFNFQNADERRDILYN